MACTPNVECECAECPQEITLPQKELQPEPKTEPKLEPSHSVKTTKPVQNNKSNSHIMCNDGTRSPSCTSCSRGCCSRHGGC